MAEIKLLLACRGSQGLNFINGPPSEGALSEFQRDESSLCRDMRFTENGSLFAWCNGSKVIVLSTENFKQIQVIDRPRTVCLKFSPKGNHLSTWEPYVARDTPQESHNLFVWDVHTGKCVKSFIQKKQTHWYPHWTEDERLCARNVSNEVHFFDSKNFDTITRKMHLQKVTHFSVAPGPPEYHVACYVPGVKGQPSFLRLFRYPQFEGANAVVAQKSFYKADRIEFYWNAKGTDLIGQTFSDVDKTDASYYGEQNLYYLSTKGETAKVKLGKEGPIYALQWGPNSMEFCVVYGYMPCKTTIYNLKCETVFDFPIGHRNEVHYTQLGNRLILCGFGNLRGNIEVWDLRQYKLITNFTATDSTCLSWSPTGEFILTATTAPRLRIGNGYRMWHYTGSLLQEVFIDSREELWDIQWMPVPTEKLKLIRTNTVPIVSIESSVPQASKQAYRPPGARGQPSTFKLHDEFEKTVALKDAEQHMSKNKKKNLARKAKKEQERNEHDDNTERHSSTELDTITSVSAAVLTGDPEKDKRIKSVIKKLEQIQKLKQDQKAGKQLERNQVEKISKEKELIEELAQLQH